MQRVPLALALIALAPVPAICQVADQSLVRSEVRADALLARVNLLQGGIGVAVRTGYNVRLHFAGAGGVALQGGAHESSLRADATLRLLLDPFGESRVGLSIGGGVSVLHDGFEDTRAVGVLVLGLEGPPRTPIVWGLEGGLGGGIRLGLVLRRRVGRYR
jgi:hypothetical protein